MKSSVSNAKILGVSCVIPKKSLSLYDEPNLYEIDEIISRDVTLTYSLLKLVNSAFFALRTKVTSVRQALAILGIKQLKGNGN